MEESDLSNLQAQMRDFEIRVAQWRQRYQEFLQMFAEFRQQQAEFASQIELHHQKHSDLKDMRTDLKRIRQEQDWKREKYP
jgi:menaquinone-dependent protoporphyrinogen IX oxidase